MVNCRQWIQNAANRSFRFNLVIALAAIGCSTTFFAIGIPIKTSCYDVLTRERDYLIYRPCTHGGGHIVGTSCTSSNSDEEYTCFYPEITTQVEVHKGFYISTTTYLGGTYSTYEKAVEKLIEFSGTNNTCALQSLNMYEVYPVQHLPDDPSLCYILYVVFFSVGISIVFFGCSFLFIGVGVKSYLILRRYFLLSPEESRIREQKRQTEVEMRRINRERQRLLNAQRERDREFEQQEVKCLPDKIARFEDMQQSSEVRHLLVGGSSSWWLYPENFEKHS